MKSQNANYQTINQFLEVNELKETEDVLYKVSIHAMDEEVDPPKLTSNNVNHLLRLLKLFRDLRK